MKKNKFLIVYIIIFVIIISIILILLNNKKNIICSYDDNIIYNITFNKKINNININYSYNFNTMDEVVDKYDEVNSYLNFINVKDGVKTKIEQNEKKLEYSIDLDINKLNKDEYDLYGIDGIIKLKNKKEIVKYFENLNYKCE